MTNETDEKRGAYRAPMGTKVSWTVDNHKWHEDLSQDVSSSGMMIRTMENIEPGTVIKLKFRLPNLKYIEPIIAKAQVMRVIERHGRQIGLGIQFTTINSLNFQVVTEFVCRILGLPLEDTLADLGSQSTNGYSFEMDRLAKESTSRMIKLEEAKMAIANAKIQKEKLKTWAKRAFWAAILGVIVYLGVKMAFGFKDFLECLKCPPQ